ncbi:MAG: hypothetical protein KKA73_25420 [Chloroflexi bacterium]|nr:hypothetical protein [Chloroflexota bacterium]
MAEFTREAAEDIWATDAPRIIQDYTDHGIEHSKRLARFATQLLEANDGRPLSSQEMYLSWQVFTCAILACSVMWSSYQG